MSYSALDQEFGNLFLTQCHHIQLDDVKHAKFYILVKKVLEVARQLNCKLLVIKERYDMIEFDHTYYLSKEFDTVCSFASSVSRNIFEPEEISYSALANQFSTVCGAIELSDEIDAAWYPIVKSILYFARRLDIKISLIKQKFGEIRFCHSNVNDEFSTACSFATALSNSICCKCGNVGQLRVQNDWYLTGCDNCFPDWTVEKAN